MVYSHTCGKVILYPALSIRQQGNLYSFSEHYLVVLDSWENKEKIHVLVTPTVSIYVLVQYFSELMWSVLFYLGWNCWWLWRVLPLCSRASWLWTFQTLLCCWDGRSCSRLTVKFNGSIFTGMLIVVNESTDPFFAPCVKWNFCFNNLCR